jgi:hypothetical protein
MYTSPSPLVKVESVVVNCSDISYVICKFAHCCTIRELTAGPIVTAIVGFVTDMVPVPELVQAAQ